MGHNFNLEKVNLTAPGQKFDLTKASDENFDDIIINLNWNQGQKAAPVGFWQKLLGQTPAASSSAIDLDLGCLYELKSGERSAIQALGNDFGAYSRAPFIELSADDRTGASDDGETMLVNGKFWNRVKRVLVFANIYEGVANWDQTDGRVTITATGHQPVEVLLTNGRNDRNLCAIAMLENVGGNITITRHVDYFRDQRELDRAFSWGLDWVAGTK